MRFISIEILLYSLFILILMIKRKPVVAGMFYQDTFDKLDKQITLCFENKLGPGELPGKRKNKIIKGGIAPHAGYSLSGPCAAWFYKEIGEAKLPDCYIILGPNHSGTGSDFSTYLFSDWETPFGDVKIDKNLAYQLTKNFPKLINESGPNLQEHSIEVQLPFLQFANRNQLDKIKILPILIKNYDYSTLTKLAKAISELDKNITIIASSDFTHYGPNYGFTPFLHAIKDNIYRIDGKALDLIKEFNSQEFLKYSSKQTICGVAPIITAMQATKKLGAEKARTLSYYTSGDITEDYKNAVGYASLIFE